jgi:hypothetical protein
MKKLNILVNIGLFLSILAVLLNDFVLRDIPELFIYGHDIGSILSNLSLAYVASYIFYRIVVVEREKIIRKKIYKSVSVITKKVIFHGYYVYSVLQDDEKLQLNYSASTKIEMDTFLLQCEIANPNTISRFTKQIGELELKRLSKIESLHDQCCSCVEKEIKRIFMYLPYLEIEHIQLLNDILDSELYKMDNSLSLIKTNTNFKVISKYMFDYFTRIRELDKYYETEIITFA